MEKPYLNYSKYIGAPPREFKCNFLEINEMLMGWVERLKC
jgi:hypothetical protein